MSKRIYQFLTLILLIFIFLICGVTYIYLRELRLRDFKENLELKRYMSTEIIDNSLQEGNKDTENQEDSETLTIEKTERMIKLEALQNENSDIIGWLEIPDTNISYPVLQGKDNSFYMTHNYKKQYSSEGSLFLDKDYDWNIPSSNLLIYGHNNRGTNEMFCGLLNYKDENFYSSHKIIRFTTQNEDSEFQVLSVFKSKVYYESDKNVFRYYYFINANTKEEFDEYISNCKKISLYNTGISAEFGEQLMTLSIVIFIQKMED